MYYNYIIETKGKFMSEKISKLIQYFDTTLDLIHHKHISDEQGYKILSDLEPELVNNKQEIYSYIQYYHNHKFDYWYNFLFAKDEEALDYLKAMTKSQYASDEALKKIIIRFLEMPENIKKEFYETNFTEIKNNPKNQAKFVSMCNHSYVLAKPSTIFHNLATLYLVSSKSNTDMDLVEKIIKDMKQVLKLSDSKFLDTYGNALIHTLDIANIYKQWTELEIDKRKDFQESFTTRLIYRGNVKLDTFETLLEKKRLPYDVKHPRGNQYLMSMLINHKLNNVTSYFRTTPFSDDELRLRMQQTKEYMIEITKKYDLYFFDHSILETNSKTMTANFVNHYSKKDKELFAKMEGEVLKYQFEIDDIFKKKELKQTKKLKL
jgi:hypothetical protein